MILIISTDYSYLPTQQYPISLSKGDRSVLSEVGDVLYLSPIQINTSLRSVNNYKKNSGRFLDTISTSTYLE